ncbi:MAG: YARHG domain-containing protein [Myxococcales bacterium]|nr:YARHG domain-containing protein [Myxococcales bacterium]
MKQRTLFCLLAACLGVILAAGAATANDAEFRGDGATVYLVKNERIRMLEEEIEIKNATRPDESYTFRAHCRFRFRNLSDQPVTVEMGFPDWRANPYEEDAKEQYLMRDFRVTVAGKRLPTKHKKVVENNGQSQVRLADGGKLACDAAYTWQVRFKPKQEIVVVNEYSFGGFATVGGLWEYAREKSRLTHADVFWGNIKPKLNYDMAGFTAVTYIVTSGLSWAESIGKAKISLEIPPDLPPNRLLPAPAGYHIRDGKVVWEFADWKPQTEITLYLIRNFLEGDTDPSLVFGNVAEARAWAEWAEKNRFDRASVNLVKNALFARHGHAFQNPRLTRYFSRFDWYRKLKKRPVALADLPPDEQEMVTVLEKLEKSLPEK